MTIVKMLKNIIYAIKRMFHPQIYTHVYKIVEMKSFDETYQCLALVSVEFDKCENCINCGKKLNYDDTNLAVCDCNAYIYSFK